MKQFHFLFIVVCVVVLSSCQKVVPIYCKSCGPNLPVFNILYTAISPNITINYASDSTYYFDLDKDGVMDIEFKIEASTFQSGNSMVQTYGDRGYSLNSNTLLSVGEIDNLGHLTLFGFGSAIDKYQHWESSLTLLAGSPFGTVGYWSNLYPWTGYIGIQIMKGGKPYYGWMKLNVPSLSSYVFMEYAMDLKSNPYIDAGQTK